MKENNTKTMEMDESLQKTKNNCIHFALRAFKSPFINISFYFSKAIDDERDLKHVQFE